MTWRPIYAVLEREVVRMFRQKTRLLSAMVRPLIWLFVIGTGFGAVARQSGGMDYQQFLLPGILGMTALFGAMLAALTVVYDKESGVMRMMIIAPFPHYWIIVAKTLAAALAGILQCLLLLLLLVALGRLSSNANYFLLAIAVVTTSLACAGIGMLVATFARTLDNFAAIMNFVIFPVFFLSGALYPVQNLPTLLGAAASINPFTYGVDLIKHAVAPHPLDVSANADFTVAWDFAILATFTCCATAIASWRFSQESAYEPMITRLTGKRGG